MIDNELNTIYIYIYAYVRAHRARVYIMSYNVGVIVYCIDFGSRKRKNAKQKIC